MKQYISPILWSAFILIVCFIPGNEIPTPSLLNIPHFDKLVHFILYFILAYLLLKSTEQPPKTKHYIYTIAYSLLLGIFIEFIQDNYIPFRSGDQLDALADVLGAIFGATTIRLS